MSLMIRKGLMAITMWLYGLHSHVVTDSIYDQKCSHICHYKTRFFF
jgi:hypothetical protein